MIRMPPLLLDVDKRYEKEVQQLVKSPDAIQKLLREDDAEKRAQEMMVRNLSINNVMLLSVKPNGDIVLNKYKRSGVVLMQWNFGQP